MLLIAACKDGSAAKVLNCCGFFPFVSKLLPKVSVKYQLWRRRECSASGRKIWGSWMWFVSVRKRRGGRRLRWRVSCWWAGCSGDFGRRGKERGKYGQVCRA